MRFLFFENDEAHQLGETPLPDGAVRIYRRVDDAAHLSYEGGTETKYIPVGQKAELPLGPASTVTVEPVLMESKAEKFLFDREGNISGFDAIEGWLVRAKNRRDVPVRVEVTRNFRHGNHDLENFFAAPDAVAFVKDDLDTGKYTLEVPARSETAFSYRIRYREGERAQK